MELNFQQRLNEELLRSERRRIIIIISLFTFAMGYRVVDMYFFSVDEETRRVQTFLVIWLFPLLIILFELFCLFFINKRLRTTQKKIPITFQYINAAFEIGLLSFIMFSVALQHPSYDVLRSPAVFVYFIFIILSTLRLHFRLSVFCGLLASASYVVLSVFVYGHFDTNDSGRALILLLSGVAAGLVAKQIRGGINSSLREAEKRHRVESLFGQQISNEVAEKMLESNGRIESKRMKVTVMFIDIRNFTHFAAGKTPEEIVHYQNAFFAIVVKIISGHNGIVHQFLGDGCMATFGAPFPLTNPSQKAVSAAIEILEQLKLASQSGDITPTRVGIGIHTGEAVTGNIGTDARQQYCVTGTVVIMASRIEQLNKEFHSEILVSEEVIRNTDSTIIETRIYRDIALKGFGEPVSVYQVV
jgi:adenylate cyclase